MDNQDLSRETRAGMTFIELIIAVTLFGIIITSALATFSKQNAAYQQGVDRVSVLRGARYAMAKLETDLRTAGTHVPGSQPELVYGGDDVIAFSADYATNVADDPFAVYFEPGAPAGQVILPDNPVSIPRTTVSFPDTVIRSFGVKSPAELIIFYFAPDSASEAQDDYVLYRQVNAGAPERVASQLKRLGAEPFFEYMRIGAEPNGAIGFREVADSAMPLFNPARGHQTTADTGRTAIPDSVRAVRVNLMGTNGRSGERERTVEMSRLIDLSNTGFGVLNTCGSRPILGSTVAAAVVTLGSGDQAIRLSWVQAVDEAMGEQDVVRYAIWRRLAGTTDWGDPFRAIPAGQTAYAFDDDDVTPGVVYEYALAAQDCTPALSPLTTSNPVVIP